MSWTFFEPQNLVFLIFLGGYMWLSIYFSEGSLLIAVSGTVHSWKNLCQGMIASFTTGLRHGWLKSVP